MTKDEFNAITTMDEGDTVELSDGRTVRLRMEPDDTNPFDEFDVYGKIASAERVWDHHGERVSRPEGFTGNAEKMWLQQNGGCVWWEPPEDGPKRTDPSFAEFRSQVNDLASFGTHGYILELCDGEDAYGHAIVKEVASLWGIEPFPTAEYRQDIVTDLLAELGLEIEQ